jgi:hypothetical protein
LWHLVGLGDGILYTGFVHGTNVGRREVAVKRTAGTQCPKLVSACPFGAAVCTDWRRRESGECHECWAGVLAQADAQSEWLRQE